MQQIWDSILELIAKLVSPDWGALIALIPIGILALIVLFLGWTFRRMASLGPSRRGKAPLTPRTPEGIHMPGSSFAPVFGGVGVALLVFGLVFGGTVLLLGLVALVLALLYWGRESMRDFDRATSTETTLPAVVHTGPPPGVHMPGPSFRPILAAMALAVLMYGLVFGGWMLAVGLAMLLITLVGWLRDARLEYALVERADATGHLENAPSPKVPSGTLALFGFLILLGIVLNSGLIPPKAADGTTGSPEPSSAAAASAAAASVVAADVTITAEQLAFTPTAVTAPAGKPFTIAFVNKDAGIPHNLAIKNTAGNEVFKGDIINGVVTKVYQVPALDAGTYPFACSVHPGMTGTLTVK
jgi:plastocyanin